MRHITLAHCFLCCLQVNGYDYSNPVYGHFTQIVWVATTELGCGVAQCSGGAFYVCQYNPPGMADLQHAPPSIASSLSMLTLSRKPAGNYIGQFDQNVLRP
jgi:hypothetical protein